MDVKELLTIGNKIHRKNYREETYIKITSVTIKGKNEVGDEDEFDIDSDSLQYWELYKEPEKKYVPFTWETIQPYKDKWIKEKDTDNSYYKIVCIRDNKVAVCGIAQTYNITFGSLLNNYQFEDGTPCGVEVVK